MVVRTAHPYRSTVPFDRTVRTYRSTVLLDRTARLYRLSALLSCTTFTRRRSPPEALVTVTVALATVTFAVEVGEHLLPPLPPLTWRADECMSGLADAGDDDSGGCITLEFELLSQTVRVYIHAAHEDLRTPDVVGTKRLLQLLQRHVLQDAEPRITAWNRIPSEVRDSRVEHPQPLAGSKITDETCANNRTVGVEDEFSWRCNQILTVRWGLCTCLLYTSDAADE